MKKALLVVGLMSISMAAFAADSEKVACPNLEGSYVCGVECEDSGDGAVNSPKGCIANPDFFGMVDGLLTQNDKVEIGFKISQRENEKGQTVYNLYKDSYTAFDDVVLDKNAKIKTSCQHEKSFIIQMSSSDMVFTGKQWLSTLTLSSQSFSKSSNGSLIVTLSEAMQDVNTQGLKLVTKKLTCVPKKWQNE